MSVAMHQATKKSIKAKRSYATTKRSVYAPVTEEERRAREWMAQPVPPTDLMVREFTDYLKSIVVE